MASVKSPMMTTATQGLHGPGMSSAGAGPASSVAGSSHLNGSGYFNQQYLQPQQTSPAPSHSYSTQHLQQQTPARSPYTDSQNFMPSNQQILHDKGEDDQTVLNTIANAHIPPQPSSVNATAGASPAAGPSSYSHTDGATDIGTNNDDAKSNMNSYSHSTHTAGNASAPGGAGVAGSSVGAGGSRFAENWDASQRGSSIVDQDERSAAGDASSIQLSRSNTLKKKASLRRSSSLHRSSSRRSMKAGSVRSLALQSRSDTDESHSAFYCPVPTKGNPTELLANRFQAWRKILKDLIAYHREIQNHYEQRTKAVQRLSSTLHGCTLPPGFIVSGGLDDAAQVLRNFHKQSIMEATKAREIEEDVILALTGLRSDLNQKIKEIKNISGDFRNQVDKEMDATKKAVKHLQDVLGQTELDSSLTTGRQDPYLLRLAADRQLERQLQEENYLHQAFLNLEKSGRELESIVVGEIQKSYNAYAGILKREAGLAWSTVEELRTGPIAMPKDQEWKSFIRASDEFVDPDVPLRSFEFIHYPGQNHYACQEIRAGLLERKSKYLKSYTAGWYVLSPTHLHEFKSADKMQAPVMSLYLPEQKLGSHSAESASSSKFVLKGRQTGGLHRGHTWVFRAESYDTMMAWYEDIRALTEKSPQEREDFARGHMHTRSTSRASQYTYSSDGVVNEDDDEPFAVNSPAGIAGAAAGARAAEEGLSGMRAASGEGEKGAVHPGADSGAAGFQGQQQYQPQQPQTPAATNLSRRPSQGGRFPSDLQVNAQRGLEVQAAGIPVSPASANGSGSGQFSRQGSDYGVIAAAGALPGSHQQAQNPDGYAYPQQLQSQSQQQPQPQYQQPPYQQSQQVHQYQAPSQPPQQPYQSYGVNQPTDGTPQQYYQPDTVSQADQYNGYTGQTAQPQPTSTLGGPAVIPMFAAVNTTDRSSTPFSQSKGVPGEAGLTDGSAVLVNGDSGYTNTSSGRDQQEPPQLAAGATGAPYATAPVIEKTNRVLNGPGVAERPGPLAHKESEAVTISGLHIPGQYPRTLTESKQ